MRIGIFGGDTAERTIDDVIEHARLAEGAGFSSYSLPQIFALDAMGVLAIVGREVPRITLATGVVPTYGRHPLTMAQQALTVQAASGGRFKLGIGLSHQMVIEGMRNSDASNVCSATFRASGVPRNAGTSSFIV